MNKDFYKFKIALVLIACVTFANVESNQATAQEKLPSAEEVIAKYVEATGGLEKYKAIKSMQQNGTISIPAAGINGTLEMKAVSPNKVATKAILPGAGNELSGSNGEVVWTDSTMTGSRILKGEEAEQTIREANFARIYDPGSVYKSLEVVGIEEVDGEKCYQVKVVKKGGGEQQEFYSIETGLQTKSIVSLSSAMGEMEIEVTVSGYKEVGGIKFPHKMSQSLPNGMVINVELEKIELNPEFEKGTFDLPESIQKMVDKQKKKDADKADEDK